jgi:hypothetical protein
MSVHMYIFRGRHGYVFDAMKFHFVVLFLLTTACSAQPTEPVVLADSAFSGLALLDANGNGEIDSEDTPVENAAFYVEIDGVKVFGDTTDETGNAFILIPGGVEYPVNIIMEAPADSSLKPVTPSMVTLSESAGATQFLFSSETK